MWEGNSTGYSQDGIANQKEHNFCFLMFLMPSNYFKFLKCKEKRSLRVGKDSYQLFVSSLTCNINCT